jgi:ribosome-associated protein
VNDQSPLEAIDLEKPASDTNAAREPADPASVAKALRIAAVALELKAEEPVLLDVRSITSYADVFAIVGGRSDRHVRSVGEAIVTALQDLGDEPLGVEGLDAGHWVLIDANDVVIHVFDPDTRERYDLERLWSDAVRIEVPGVENNDGGRGGGEEEG